MDNAEPTRYRVAPIEHQMTYGGGVLESTPDGPLVAYGDYARLKAECQARQAENSVLAVECDSLKAEVERLVDERCLRGEGMKQKEIRIARLLAKVERLTKAGDAMMRWIDHQHDDSGYEHSESWETAKKGGQK